MPAQFGMAVCSCGRYPTAVSATVPHFCPWCGKDGMYGAFRRVFMWLFRWSGAWHERGRSQVGTWVFEDLTISHLRLVLEQGGYLVEKSEAIRHVVGWHARNYEVVSLLFSPRKVPPARTSALQGRAITPRKPDTRYG